MAGGRRQANEHSDFNQTCLVTERCTGQTRFQSAREAGPLRIHALPDVRFVHRLRSGERAKVHRLVSCFSIA